LIWNLRKKIQEGPFGRGEKKGDSTRRWKVQTEKNERGGGESQVKRELTLWQRGQLKVEKENR